MMLAALLILGGVSYAQQSGAEAGPKPPSSKEGSTTNTSARVRRLESVSWDAVKAQLIWVLSVWDLESDKSEPSALERYVIHVDSGLMENNGEVRPFQVRGSDLQSLMSLVCMYAMRSTIWWNRVGASKDDTPSLMPDGSNGPGDKTKESDPKDSPEPSPDGVAKVRSLVPLQERGIERAR